HRFAIRPLARHGIKGISQADNTYRGGDVFHPQTVGVPGTVAALMMPTHDLGNAWPGKLHAAHNLMADHGVVRHFAKFFRSARAGLAEKTLVHSHFADVVQI